MNEIQVKRDTYPIIKHFFNAYSVIVHTFDLHGLMNQFNRLLSLSSSSIVGAYWY